MWKYFLISSVLWFSSCRKDPTIPFCELHPDQCREVSEPKDYFLFGVGSYWVYQEENSGMIDSMYVTTSYSGPECYGFDVVVHSDFDGYDYNFWSILATGGCPSCGLIPNDKHCVIIKKSKGKPGDFVSESYCFFTNEGIGDWIYSYGGEPYGYDNFLLIENVYDSLEIGGKIYFDVLCVSEDHTASESSQKTRHYYSKGVGLVKAELIDSNEIWSISNYEIVE